MARAIHFFLSARLRTLPLGALVFANAPTPSPPFSPSRSHPLPPLSFFSSLPKNCKTSQSTSKNPFCFPRPSRQDLIHFAPHPLPPPHVAPGARCHVVVQSAVSSSPSSSHGMRVSRWHTDTPSAPPSRYYGTIVVVVWCTRLCRAPEHPSSTTTSPATPGYDAVPIGGATRTGRGAGCGLGGWRCSLGHVHYSDMYSSNFRFSAASSLALLVHTSAIPHHLIDTILFIWAKSKQLRCCVAAQILNRHQGL